MTSKDKVKLWWIAWGEKEAVECSNGNLEGVRDQEVCTVYQTGKKKKFNLSDERNAFLATNDYNAKYK